MKRLAYSIVTLASVTTLYAGDPVTPPPMMAPTPTPEPSSESAWWVRSVAYGWITAIDGDVSVGSLSAPIDISMSDTLDSLDLAAMGLIEFGYGRWSAGVDIVYAKTSQDLGAGGRIFDSFRYEQKQWLITPVLAYRAWDSGRSHLDILAGARITSMEATLTGRFVRGGQRSASNDSTWADPIVGLRGRLGITESLFCAFEGDIGGFGVSSDLVWQAFAGLGYDFTKNFSIAAGYRGLGIDYSKDNFSLDTVTHGPVIGLELRF